MKPNVQSPVLASIQQNSLTDEMRQLLTNAGSGDPSVALVAQGEIASGIRDVLNSLSTSEEALRDGVMDGDIVTDIFYEQKFDPTQNMQIPLSLLAPGTEKNHIAYVMPDVGRVPDRIVTADYINLNTYQVSNSIGCSLRFFRNARTDILSRMIEVLQSGFTKKTNDDGWRTLLTAIDGRGIVAYDADATAGQFTPKLVSIMKTVMRRNGGGNSTSVNRRKLTDLYMSPEAFEDMTAWGLNLIPDAVRQNIFRSTDGSLSGFFGVNFHDIDELGVGQEYQAYYQTTLSGSMGPSSDEELVVGLDLTNKKVSFLMPVSMPLQVYEDNTQHRLGLASFYGHKEHGFAACDTRFCLAGSF